MNIQEMALIMKRVSSAYGKVVSAEQMRSYLVVLGRYPRLRVAAAATNAMGECKFLPTPAELKRAVDKLDYQPFADDLDEAMAWLCFVNGYGSPDELTEADIQQAKLEVYGDEGLAEINREEAKLYNQFAKGK